MKLKLVVLLTLQLALSSAAFAGGQEKLEANKALVVKFYEMAFMERQATDAANRYISEDYIQHNPYTANGRKAFIDYAVSFATENPDAYSEIKRVIAEGDLVVLHVHDRLNKDDRGTAVVDIFRVEDGLIVEHWDVLQQIPEVDISGNSMF